jgi:hypothetical protein
MDSPPSPAPRKNLSDNRFSQFDLTQNPAFPNPYRADITLGECGSTTEGEK